MASGAPGTTVTLLMLHRSRTRSRWTTSRRSAQVAITDARTCAFCVGVPTAGELGRGGWGEGYISGRDSRVPWAWQSQSPWILYGLGPFGPVRLFFERWRDHRPNALSAGSGGIGGTWGWSRR
jgi:hypothetical protein